MLMVLMLHTGVIRRISGLDDLSLPYYVASIAIPLFFMVNGYLLSGKNRSAKYCLYKIFKILLYSAITCTIIDVLNWLKTGGVEISFPICLLHQGGFNIYWYFGASILIYLILPLLQLLSQNIKILKYICISLLVFNFLVFLFDLFYGFEQNNVIQTFRIWYWVLFFLIGSFFRKKQCLIKQISWLHIIILFVLCLLIMFVTEMDGGIEFYYGCPILVVYASAVFLQIKNIQIKSSRVISTLSNCFLPTYSFHMLIIRQVVKNNTLGQLESFSPCLSFIVQYLVITIICITTSIIIMKTPYINRIFKL